MDKSKTLQKATLGGSILAAITASLCCIGPLVAVALGAGGFAASAVFEKWRPVFLGVTFALLALAWYLTYRKPKTACEEGSACATKPVSKWNKMVLWFATGVVLIMAAFPSLSSASLSSAILRGSQRPIPAVVAGPNSAILKVKIPSMDCAACAVSIQAKLRKQSGIENAEVSFATKEAVVQYDATRLSPEKIIAAIDETGFKAEPSNK
ncbi:MAG: mercuric transporter MerT family protein [Verrucomicrobia bacterium]|nr:mercuric transporter MerT family protein [Verrucomicrobiota bacterium]